MTSPLPANRTQMWLARGAVVVCIILIVALRTLSGFGEIKSVREGSATTYYGPSFGTVVFGVIGLLACVLGVAFWMQPGRLFRVASIVLFLLAIYVFVNAPSLLYHRTVVTPDSFYHRVGAWYSPVETYVAFDEVSAIEIVEIEPSRNGRTELELRFTTKPGGNVVAVPFHGLVRKALPEILRNVATRDVAVGDNAEAWQFQKTE